MYYIFMSQIDEQPDKVKAKEVLFVIILLLMCFGIPFLAVQIIVAFL